MKSVETLTPSLNNYFSLMDEQELQNLNDRKAHLKNYAKFFTESFTVFDLENIFIAGGAISSAIRWEKPNDVDFFFKKPLTEKYVKEKLLTKESVFDSRYGGTLITKKREGISCPAQFILFNFGTPDGVISTFDYYHTRHYYDVASDKLVMSSRSYFCSKYKLLFRTPDTTNRGAHGKQRRKKFLDDGYKEIKSEKEYTKEYYKILENEGKI